jgi:hypothetical protein
MEKFSASILKYDQQPTPDMTDEQLKEELAQTPGIEVYKRQKLAILAIDYKGVSETDERWIGFSVVLGKPEWKQSTEMKDGEEKRIFVNEKNKKQFPINQHILVPRGKTVTYNGKNGPTPYVYRNAQDFIAALGHTLLPSNNEEVVGRLFADPEKLVGAMLDVQPGYERDYVGRNEEGGYSVFNKHGVKRKLFLNGEEVVNNYDSREVAEGEAIACGVDVDMRNTYPKILKFFAAKEPFAVKKKVSFDD